MANDTWIGKKGFRYWYYRFRDSEYYGLAIVGVTLFVCVILLFNIIIPEFTHWFSIRDEVVATREKITTLQQNINFISNLDKNMLDSQLQTVSHALPPDKNFGYMLNALSNAAANSGVSLNDYSFQVGDVVSTQGAKANGVSQNGLSDIQITVTLTGSIEQVRQFIKSLENNLPVSQVTSINGSGENVSVQIEFYQKPFSNVNVSDDTPVQSLSPEKTDLLQNLAKWDNTSGTQTSSPVSSSNSAVPLF